MPEAPEHPEPGRPPGDPAALARHRFLFRAIARRLNPALRRSDITVTDERVVKRATKAAALGNAMEWFDFGIYSYLAVTIGKVFYSGAGPSVQTLSSLATFAISFLVRPIGGAFFGPLGDRIGRKRVLATTMLMMAAGTFCVGLLPTYATFGFGAPLLLILCRLVQGFSTGGEYGGASTFIAEYAPDRKRGYYGSYLEFGTLCGYIAAAGLVVVLQTNLSDSAMLSWGWRIPFLVGGPVGAIGLYLRMKLDETPAFAKAAEASAATVEDGAVERIEISEKVELRRLFRDEWRALLLCIALVGAYNVTDYMLLSYMPTYLTDTLDYPATHGTLVLIGTMALMVCVINQVGRLNDHYGRKPLLMTGMLGFLVLTVPAFLLLKAGALWQVCLGMVMLGLSLVCLLGTMSAALPALFPTKVRYGGLAIGYNISASVFGGTTPLVMDALVKGTRNDMTPAYYTVFFALIGVVSVAVMRETAGKPLAGSPPSVSTPEEARELVESQAGHAPLEER
ncbi:MFS transporter [Phaeacidiphilus oryzae]|uniref:MFS transporter n=1 Tax=Phaeacidiphilus oryzae TaxID=348818 RepID=UPI00055B84C5|nr:MFS transporter [Phaeacidiphilus oryzae]